MVSGTEFDPGHADAIILSPEDPYTPQDDIGPQPLSSSHVTLPSTEDVPPASPMDTDESFRSEISDDRPAAAAAAVIPSSLTPPPSTQTAAHAHSESRRAFSQSQPESALCSPPATILKTLRDREPDTDYTTPTPQQILKASADELRLMLQACIAEKQKLKMETAHHKLQYNLLSRQSEDDAQRSAVEHEMIRREVDVLRTAEHSRQARRELSAAADSTQAKYLQMKMWYEAAMEENGMLHRRLKVAKKLIQQKEEETMHMEEERDMLLTRIRENREHFHMMCSPGGIFHGAMTPKQQQDASSSTPQHQQQQQQQQHRPSHGTRHHTPRSLQRAREEREQQHVNGREHGLSALLQAMSQSQGHSQSESQDTSAPSTPAASHRSAPKHSGRHHRHSQSMSSLPTTPLNWSRGGDNGLLPSVDLVPQSEPRYHYGQQQFVPATPPSQRDGRRKSRESTISVDDNEELARQALESVEGLQSVASHAAKASSSSSSSTTTPPPPPPPPPLPSQEESRRRRRRTDCDGEDGEVFDSQASQAATEMLRRHPLRRGTRSFETGSSAGCRAGTSPRPAEQSARLQARLLSSTGVGVMDKRKFSGSAAAAEKASRENGSPAKRTRTGLSPDERRVGLGIQYGR